MKRITLVSLMLLSLIFSIALAIAEDVPQVTDEQKELAIMGIKTYDEVQDAAIVQDEKTLSLALIVGYATNEETAKELGDSFVRMVKSNSGDTPPGKEIGSGIFTYYIGVYYPDKSEVVSGAKCGMCKSIYW
jgi:hypothetical protein